MRSLLPQVTPRYFGSEWSFAQIRGLEARTIVAFGAREHTVICAFGYLDAWVDGGMDAWVEGWMQGWRDGCMGGGMDGWMDAWVEGWMACILSPFHNTTQLKATHHTCLLHCIALHCIALHCTALFRRGRRRVVPGVQLRQGRGRGARELQKVHQVSEKAGGDRRAGVGWREETRREEERKRRCCLYLEIWMGKDNP
jgi:hypothetical protein